MKIELGSSSYLLIPDNQYENDKFEFLADKIKIGHKIEYRNPNQSYINSKILRYIRFDVFFKEDDAEKATDGIIIPDSIYKSYSFDIFVSRRNDKESLQRIQEFCCADGGMILQGIQKMDEKFVFECSLYPARVREINIFELGWDEPYQTAS